jgi:hypothetical protein
MNDDFQQVTCPYCQERFTTAGETMPLIATKCTACGQRLMVRRRKLLGKTITYKPVDFWLRFLLAMIAVAVVTFFYDPGWLGMESDRGTAISLLTQLGLFIGLIWVTWLLFMETGGTREGE